MISRIFIIASLATVWLLHYHAVSPSCPKDWIENHVSCYYIGPSVSLSKAQGICSDKGSQLATFADIFWMISQGLQSAWLGLSESGSGHQGCFKNSLKQIQFDCPGNREFVCKKPLQRPAGAITKNVIEANKVTDQREIRATSPEETVEVTAPERKRQATAHSTTPEPRARRTKITDHNVDETTPPTMITDPNTDEKSSPRKSSYNNAEETTPSTKTADQNDDKPTPLSKITNQNADETTARTMTEKHADGTTPTTETTDRNVDNINPVTKKNPVATTKSTKTSEKSLAVATHNTKTTNRKQKTTAKTPRTTEQDADKKVPYGPQNKEFYTKAGYGNKRLQEMPGRLCYIVIKKDGYSLICD